MAFRERIEVILGLDGSSFLGGLKAVRAEVAATEGFTNKLKVGVKGLGSSFSEAAKNPAVLATAAAAAGTALFKAAESAADLALSVGKMSDATGLGVDATSRLTEVSGDLGINIDSVEKSIAFMNKTLGNSPELFRGIKQSAADGTTDVNATFLAVIERLHGIKDAGERGALATKLLGRNWADLSEFVGQGADKLKQALDGVDGSKVLNDSDVAQARSYRKAMDDLSDSFGEMALQVGQNLLPVLTRTADLVTFITKGASNFGGVKIEGMDELTALEPQLKAAGFSMAKLYEALATGQTTIKKIKDDLAAATIAYGDTAEGQAETARETAKLTGAMETQIGSLGRTAAETSETDRETRRLSNSTDDAWRASRDFADQLAKQKDALKNLQEQELSAIDKTFALVHATQANDKAHADYIASLKDSKATEQDRNEAFVNATQSAYEQAKAFADLEKQNGNVSSSIDLMRVSLQQQADKLGPNDPLRKGIEALIGQLEAIPQAVPPPIKVTLDAQIMSDTKKKLGELIALLASVKTAGSSLVVGQLGGKKKAGEGFRARGTEGFSSVSDLLGSGQAGVFAASAATADGEPDAITLARRQYQRGKLSYDQYVQILNDEKAKHAEFSDAEQSIYEELQSLAAAHAQAIADAQKAQQDAIDATTKAIEDQTAAWLANDNVQQDLADAIVKQSAAQADYNAAFAEYNRLAKDPKAKPEDRAAALKDVAQAQEALDRATIEGAKARAATKGAKGSAAYENSLRDDLLAYAQQNGDPTGALAAEANRHNLNGLSTGQGVSGSGGFATDLGPVLRQAMIEALATTPITRISDITTSQRTSTRAAT